MGLEQNQRFFPSKGFHFSGLATLCGQSRPNTRNNKLA